MGVWIETNLGNHKTHISEVTPCVGVWIETYENEEPHDDANVTPCVGVWIETITGYLPSVKVGSHPAWVCGLKPLTYLPSG